MLAHHPNEIWLFPPGGLWTLTEVGTPVPYPAAGAPPNFPGPCWGAAWSLPPPCIKFYCEATAAFNFIYSYSSCCYGVFIAVAGGAYAKLYIHYSLSKTH